MSIEASWTRLRKTLDPSVVASVAVIKEASVAAMADDDDDDEADGMVKDEAQLNDAKIMETTERKDMLRRGGCVRMAVRCGCANAMMFFSVSPACCDFVLRNGSRTDQHEPCMIFVFLWWHFFFDRAKRSRLFPEEKVRRGAAVEVIWGAIGGPGL